MKLSFFDYILYFKNPSITSRGILKKKKTYFLKWKFDNNLFLSECPYFQGLSFESENQVIEKLHWLCNNFSPFQKEIINELRSVPSILFGYEQILMLIKTKNPYLYFPSGFTNKKKGIIINGLIWMGSIKFIKQQIKEKLNQGYKCLKFKIGKKWKEEKKILKSLRKSFSEKKLEIRVDANGAFKIEKIQTILDELYELKIHSIEQPIKSGDWDNMYKLCNNTPTPIALDEELIGINNYSLKQELLEKIRPQYLVFKPSLIGGINGTCEWIQLCKKYNISWWITSALESNIGLNFIAQWTYTLKSNIPHGLGTGSLFSNNFFTPLFINKQKLFFSIDHIIKH